jgi:riboflavin transporter FmnP
MIALAPVLNYFVLIPLFINYLGPDFDIGLYLVAGAVPITAIKAVAESVVVILLYKRLSGILHKQPM